MYDDESPEEYALQEAVEGSGYHKSKGLQWLDLCPHLGTSEKTLLRVLLSLTRQDNPRRRIAPEELRHLVYSGPVALGEDPKYVSVSGLRRMLRALAALGQITTPEDRPLTFSSGQSAQSRAVTMQIWRYPRHECASRNAFDALARIRHERPRYPLAGPDMAPRWQHLPTPAPTESEAPTEDTPSDQPGQKDDQPGQKDDQPGQKDDQPGQKDDRDCPADQEEGVLPSTPPTTGPCIPPSPPAPPAADDAGGHTSPTGPAGREDEPSADEHLGRAEALVDDAVRRWPRKHRAPGPRDRQRLSERIARELADGGSEVVILDELTRDLADAGSAVRVLLGDRTKTPGWGRPVDPRPDHSRYEPRGPRPAWCGRCDERTRLVMAIRSDGSEAMRRCPGCHPDAPVPPPASAPDAAHEDEVPPLPEDLDPDVLARMRESLTAR